LIDHATADRHFYFIFRKPLRFKLIAACFNVQNTRRGEKTYEIIGRSPFQKQQRSFFFFNFPLNGGNLAD
jgi:hypothetical protein